MIAVKPARLTDIEAASVPVVVGRTAQQMLFDHAGVRAGQTVAILGGAGNVGGYAVQLARPAARGSSRPLNRLAELIYAGKLHTHVGETLSLSQARLAHAMLQDGRRRAGKIVLVP
jgi:NADPH:quinone reductase-like Zn-dependent oxidoreductase